MYISKFNERVLTLQLSRTLYSYNVTIFGIDLKFDSVAFTLPIGDGWDIYWYGICIALAFLAAVVYGFARAKKFGIDPDRLSDVVLVTAPLAILFARIYYIIFYPGKLNIKTVADFFGISSGSGMAGIAIYGAVIGAAVVGGLMCWWRKVNIIDAFDLASISFLIGQAIGRWGNFFNQEAYGTPTGSKFWGMTNLEELNGVNVHPCFLYESLWCILGFVLLHILSNHRKFRGQLALTYGVWYGFGRMIIEGLRTDSLYLGPLRISQWVSGALVLACGITLIVIFTRIKTAKKALTYETMFDDIDNTTVKTVTYYEGDETETADETESAEDTSEETAEISTETVTEADPEEKNETEATAEESDGTEKTEDDE